ncbi:unnamed protein product [Cladocopium goreaui]|uniref:Uncharacterized protein n=1 Tax=Cladocopium goreaui TaxID=2562237 RepID=A0A9P1BQT6_9DINO|nr:unnamed protein product [Cladocopium goreaui]
MGTGSPPSPRSEANERQQLVQQLLEERRQRLEQKLAETEIPNTYEDRADRPRSLLPSFDTVLNETPRQSFSLTYQDTETIAPASIWEPELLEGCRRCGKDVLKTCPFCRHCGCRLEDGPSAGQDGYVRSASSRSFKERLRDSSKQYQQNLDLRRRAQEVELTKHCTFHPVINNRSQVVAQRARGCYAEALPERLGPNDARRRSALRDQAKEILQADDLYECTFTPRINRRSDGWDDRVPLHLRTKAIQQYKQEKIRASQEAKLKQSHPFTPRISAKSHQLAQRRLGTRSKSVDCKVELEQTEACVDSGAKDGDSLQRTLANPGKASQVSGRPQDFLARQVSFQKERQFRQEVREQHACCSFRPKISDQSEQITACNVELIGETPEDRIERLAVKDVNRRQLHQQELRASRDRDCTFRPALSPQSEAIAMSRRASSPSGVHQRLYDEAKWRAREAANSPRRDFQPQPDPRSRACFAHVKPHYATPADIMESIRQQQDRRAELLLQRHEERMRAEAAGCTFRPELCSKALSEGAPVVVSGLGRFFELKSLAQRQELEQRAHEAKAFRTSCSHGPPLGITIPEPFALSQSNSCSST